MADGTSYIIVPPEDSGVTLQELIEGLQSGRIVIGGDNVVLNTQTQEEDGDQQVLLAIPEDEDVADVPTIQLSELKEEGSAETYVVHGTEQSVTQQHLDSGIPQEASLVEVSEDDLLSAVSAEQLQQQAAQDAITMAPASDDVTVELQEPSVSIPQVLVGGGALAQTTLQTSSSSPIIRQVIKRVVLTGDNTGSLSTQGTMVSAGRSLLNTTDTESTRTTQIVTMKPATQKIQTTPQPLASFSTPAMSEGTSQIRTILVSPKDARVLSMTSGGVPVLAQRRASVAGTTWQTTTDDILHTLSAADGDSDWAPRTAEEVLLHHQPRTHRIPGAEKKFACQFCTKTFKFQSSINRHLRTHTGEKPYKCKLCSFRCNREHNLKGHVLLKHCRKAAPLKCDKCTRCFVSPADLRKHVHSHSNYSYFKCGICGDRFLHNNTFRKHIINGHKGELFENPYKCAVCDIPFDKPGDVLQHVNAVHLQIGLECRYCSEPFTRSDNLERHEAEHEQREPPKRTRIGNFIEEVINKCTEEQSLTGVLTDFYNADGEVAPGVENLKIERRFECQYCGRLCMSRSKLKIHVSKMHTHEGGYQCQEQDCGRSFPYPYDLQDHMVRVHHMSELECYCGSSFVTVGELKKHMKVKNNSKLFECSRCEALFSEADMLNNHLLSDKHSGEGKIEQPFRCSRCEVDFSAIADLALHVTTHVGDQDVTRHGHPILETSRVPDGDESIEEIVNGCRIVEVPVDTTQKSYRRHFKRRRRKTKAAWKSTTKPKDVSAAAGAPEEEEGGAATADEDDDMEVTAEPEEGQVEEDPAFNVLRVTGADGGTHDLQVPHDFCGQIVVEKESFKEIHIIKDGKNIQKYSVRVYPDGREVSVDDEFAVVGLDQSDVTLNTAVEAKNSTLVLPLGEPSASLEKPPTLEPTEIDSITAIPEPVTQTVVSSDVGGVVSGGEESGIGDKMPGSYGQLLEAGLSSGGLQPSQIPQVVDALEGATVNLNTEMVYQTLAACVPRKEKRTPLGIRTRSGNLKCRFCDKWWKFPSELKKHENTHIGNRPYSCSVCGKRFPRKNNLKEHKTIHKRDVNPDELGKVVCPICGERCLYNSRLGRHIITKHSNIDFSGLDPALQEVLRNISADGYTLFKTKCDICGKMVGNIKRHVMSHNEEREFPCPHPGCGKSFKRLLHLKEHSIIHLGDLRPKIKCKKCPHTTCKKRDMDHHMVTAHGAKPKFECDVCGKGFGEGHRYKLHLKSHLPFTEREAHTCDLCGRSFRHAVSVRQHVQKVHVELNM